MPHSLSSLARALLLPATLLGLTLRAPAARADIFVSNWSTGIVGEYTNSGQVVNANLITNLNTPSALAVSGNDLFVMSWNGNKIGKYTLSSPGVIGPSTPSLITNLNHPRGMTIAGSSLYVTTFYSGSDGAVSEYSTSGTLLSTPISGLSSGPNGVLAYNNNLILSNNNSNTLSEYGLTGTPVNTSLVTGLSGAPYAMTIAGSDIFVCYSSGANTAVGKYTLGPTDGTISTQVPSLFTIAGGPVRRRPTGRTCSS